MHRRFHLPQPSLVVATIALFAALGGTAVAAGPVALAKKALFANNSGKLQGKTAAQVAAMPGPATDAQTLGGKTADQVAATPGPASSAAGLISYRTGSFNLAGNDERTFTVGCGTGERAIAGGFSTANVVLGLDTNPINDGAAWQLYLVNLSSSQPASGTVYAVCVK